MRKIETNTLLSALWLFILLNVKFSRLTLASPTLREAIRAAGTVLLGAHVMLGKPSVVIESTQP